jgi:hypothetical protein
MVAKNLSHALVVGMKIVPFRSWEFRMFWNTGCRGKFVFWLAIRSRAVLHVFSLRAGVLLP